MADLIQRFLYRLFPLLALMGFLLAALVAQTLKADLSREPASSLAPGPGMTLTLANEPISAPR